MSLILTIMTKSPSNTLHSLRSLRENAEMSSTGYRSLVKCLTLNPVLGEVLMSPLQRHAKYAKRAGELLKVNAILAALKTVRREGKTLCLIVCADAIITDVAPC